MKAERRIEELERRAGGGEGCRECGYVEGQLTEFVILSGSDRRAPRAKSCGTCGRGLAFTIDLGDGGDPFRVPEGTEAGIEKVYGGDFAGR
jgi:hypothetical protein